MVGGIIILEGPDGSGKTTLAKELAKRYEAQTGIEPCYMHGRAWQQVWKWHLGMLRRAAFESTKRLVIIDRHWVSECIYGTVLRQGPDYGSTARALHRHWLHLGALYVLCVPDPEFIVAQHAALSRGREELVKKTDQMRDVATRYMDLLKGSVVRDPQGDLVEQLANQGGVQGHANWYHYDRERERAMNPRMPKNILEMAATRRRFANVTEAWGPTTGSPTARVLVLGDRSKIDPKVRHPVNPPFLANSLSSRYLNDVFHRRLIPEGDVSFINTGNVDPRFLSETMARFARVVALGGEAAESAFQAGRRVDVVIRHPQFARRFQQHGSYDLELEHAILHGKSPAHAIEPSRLSNTGVDASA